MRFKKLSLRDKKIFVKYLSLCRHDLSTYSFANIYIWSGLFEIRWALIEDSLCVFFLDKWGAFLYLPPLARDKDPKVLEKAFSIMDSLNKNPSFSRIENVSADDLPFYRGLGYDIKYKSCDYVCENKDLISLAGHKFKSKRASFNYFIKNYKHEYLRFRADRKNECLSLYKLWMGQRKATNPDSVYRGMLEDSRNSLRVLLNSAARLDVTLRLVEVEGLIRAFTCGFRLNEETFCILYEITDLSIKGLAQFVFREFCREMGGYKYINVMDDSGLDNLKAVKLSYRPVKTVPSYIIQRKG